jgi:ABC-type transporter Mla maintaining outer membrane lipid asymmetry ATPase subunit MlaF
MASGISEKGAMMALDQSTNATAFAFQGVKRRFGSKLVLSGLDLTVTEGQFLAII